LYSNATSWTVAAPVGCFTVYRGVTSM
jgi:hypothetical protein